MPSYIRIASSRIMYLDNNGALATGYKVYTCTPGTDTLASSWSNRTLSSLNANPIILDARGQAQIFSNTALKLVFCTPASTGPTNGVIQSDDYLQEQTEDPFDIVTADTGTTYNNYTATTVPPYLSLTTPFMLILIPDVDNVDTMGATIFTGSGKNDIQFRGPYTGTTSGSVFTIEVLTAGTPDTIRWNKDGGAWASLTLTAAWQTLIEGIQFKASEVNGHTPGETWTVEVTTPAKFNFCSLGSYPVYKNMGGTMKALDGGDLKANIPATLVWSGSEWILNNPATETYDTSIVTGTRERKQVTTNYTLLATDAGNLVDCLNTTGIAITLNPATNYNGMFFYIRAGGAGDVTVTVTGSEDIFSEQNPEGATTYVLVGDAGKTIQIQCNGVSFEVLTGSTRKVTTQSFTTVGAGGSYTHTPGAKYLITLVRAGGAGGGANNGGGGGGGGVAIEMISVSALTEPVTVTIGAGGTAGTGLGDGGAGGVSSFGAYSSATGGAGGIGSGGSGGAGGTGTGGDVSISGQDGETAASGYGGASYGYLGGAKKLTGAAGNNYGGGGPGGVTGGYAGAQGRVDVIEFPEELRYVAFFMVNLYGNPIY
jgi:hypothetical protein